MRETFKKSLPRMWNARQAMASNRGRQIQKTLNNLKMTVICGFVTILVLRGTIGAGSFGTPAQDIQEIRGHVHRRKEASRVLAEADEGKDAGTTMVIDDEPPDVEISDPSKPYSLGPRISDWNEQRTAWLKENGYSITGSPEEGKKKPGVLLVTGSQPKPCDNPVGDHYLLKSIKNKVDYCRLHGIEIFYNMAHLDHEMAGYWAKLPLLRKLLLAHPEMEWIWWMDSDAMFTDMTFDLPMEKYKDYDFVLHGWDELVYNKKNWIGLNTGSFLLRNSQWSLDILDDWAPMGPKGKIRDEAGTLLSRTLTGRPDFEADDQSALVYLLMSKRDKWGSKVFLESSYYLHGYWAILTEKYEEMMEKHHPGYGDDRWPFVTHFVGCKPCGRYGDYPVERCLKQMERAFNFADNQVLQMYGFRHKSLATSKVKRTRNDSNRPLDQLQDLNSLVRTNFSALSLPSSGR